MPVLLIVELQGQIGERFPEMGRFDCGPEIPPDCLIRLSLVTIGGGNVPHGSRPFICPEGIGHGKMLFQGADAVVPAPVVEVFPPQIVGVAVVVRVLPHRELQQRQVLSPGFLRIRVVVQPHARCVHRFARRTFSDPAQHLMHRVRPFVPVPGVDLLVPEGHAVTAVCPEAPHIGIAHLGHSRRPYPFQFRPPSGEEVLVQVGADAEIGIVVHQLQGAVPGRIKAPGGELLLIDSGAPAAELLYRIIGGAGIQHNDPVRLLHGVHPAVHKPAFIFTDCINYDFHPLASQYFDTVRKDGQPHGLSV